MKIKNDFIACVQEWGLLTISTLFSSFWAYWGIIENFHEGWYHPSLQENVLMMFAQYLSPMLATMLLSIISIYFPKIGAAFFIGLAVFSGWFFRGGNLTTILVIGIPLAALGFLSWKSRVQKLRLALLISIGVPMLILLISGISPAIRVLQRSPDVSPDVQIIQGNSITLAWAPSGPGWPQDGKNWFDANVICSHLQEDGYAVSDQKMDIWRLPTIEEIAASSTRRGLNSGGKWDPLNKKAYYEIKPDKEAPLWNRFSPVIYWWTATEVDAGHAFIYAYDGRVWERHKDLTQTYLGFRCVKDHNE